MMEIKKISIHDLKAVVKVHKDSFKDFFLTKLGDDFLLLYYDCIRKDTNAILLGIYDENKLCGFCAATTLSRGYNKMLIKQNLISFVLIGLKLIITKPKALIHLFKNLNKSNPNITDNGEYAELLSIGVSDTKQGQGLGKKLMIKLESELISKGCENLSLTTDYFNNESAVEFYKISGFTIFYDFIAYPNRKMYRMIKKLNLI